MKWRGSDQPIMTGVLIVALVVLLAAIWLLCASQASAAPIFIEGIAGWYGPGFYGELMRNGEMFDSESLTFAMNGGVPDGRVYLLAWTGKVMTPQGWLDLRKSGTARARWTDTGAFTRLYGRVADLSPATMKALTDGLGFYYGLIEVRIYPCADLHMGRGRR